VKISVPITGLNPVHRRGWAEEWYYPSEECYGATVPLWIRDQPVRLAFEFKIERWASGWRLASTQ